MSLSQVAVGGGKRPNNKIKLFNLEKAIITLLSVTRLLQSELCTGRLQLKCFGPSPLHLSTSGLVIMFLRCLSHCEAAQWGGSQSYLLFLWRGFSVESGSGCGRPVQISSCGSRRKKGVRLNGEWVGWRWRVTGEGKPRGKWGCEGEEEVDF